ncbi:hypothetical protein [Stenotrophomonas humi]|uniref:hypothetical protein n=1 Tax=Stenotrophomonas humi TaxID=405444 RepID=UPI00070DCCF9|nr:hypothetical protein [Stenotrophomonas humi]
MSAQQRASADQRQEQLDIARLGLEARLHETQELARSERDNLMEHARSVENRAAREVDQARQQAKEAQVKLASAGKLHATTEQSLAAALKAAQKAATEAAKETDRQRARSEVLEEQLTKIPAAIEAALRSKRKLSAPRKKTAKTR